MIREQDQQILEEFYKLGFKVTLNSVIAQQVNYQDVREQLVEYLGEHGDRCTKTLSDLVEHSTESRQVVRVVWMRSMNWVYNKCAFAVVNTHALVPIRLESSSQQVYVLPDFVEHCKLFWDSDVIDETYRLVDCDAEDCPFEDLEGVHVMSEHEYKDRLEDAEAQNKYQAELGLSVDEMLEEDEADEDSDEETRAPEYMRKW